MTPISSNYSWTILVLILTLVACGRTTNNRTDAPKVSTVSVQSLDTSSIAIIPFDKSSDWVFDNTYSPSTLTKSDIEKIETLMTDFINNYNNKLLPDNKQYFSINLENEKFKRQYVAVKNKSGDKEVWINCLCQTHSDKWKTSIISVADGGNCYFSLKINLTKEMCYDLGVNGYA